MSVKYADIEKIIQKLMELNYKISFMESCSGGAIANAFTNIKGCSNVLEFSAVTYNNEAKIHLGVNPKTIEKYTVYSSPVSKEMAKAIAKYSNAQIGIATTGNLNLVCNDGSKGGEVYISIYNSQTKQFISKVIMVKSRSRAIAKDGIINIIAQDLMKMLSIEN